LVSSFEYRRSKLSIKLCLSNTQKQLDEQKQAETKLDKEIENAKILCKSLENDLAKIMTDIGDAKVDKFESSRNQKRTEIIEQLKKKFPGVVSVAVF
jgi:structural maintenance of chromosome 1